MDLHRLQRNWDGLGSTDPLWAILTYPDRHGNRWDEEEFFATGEDWLARYDAVLDRLGLAPAGRDRALDFGCGAGRLTRALARRYARADGVDVASSMVELARSYHRDRPELTFHLNVSPDLRRFEDASFDFVVSIIVLQHMNRALMSGYLPEFVRVLRPGGIAMFNIPSHLDLSLAGLARRVPNVIQNRWRQRRYGYAEVIELHTLHRSRVEAIVRGAGAEMVAVVPDENPGRPFHTFVYVVRKPTLAAPAHQPPQSG